MSEFELKRRREYKKNRKKWITIQTIALVLLIVIALGSFLIYDRMNRTYYIEYTENSNVDYKVLYKSNNFYDEDWIENNKTYISTLIENISADFSYALNMQTSGLDFDYVYSINAQIVVSDIDTGNPYYTVEEVLVPAVQGTSSKSSSLKLNKQVDIDYIRYDRLARDFVYTYGLKKSSSTLVVTFSIEVLSSGAQFEQNNESKYYIALNIPLALDTFSMHVTQSVPVGESKVIAYKGASDRDVFYTSGIVSSILGLILSLVLVVFIHITRNEDVNYVAKVRRILNSYSSFIQRIDGEFCSDGYQVVIIKTFNEMLGIRDTIQSPILMSENNDETMTRFLIPTNTKILYTYEIKVENFDAIYGIAEESNDDKYSVEKVTVLDDDAE